MNNDQRIAEIEARCELATPGPWKLGEDETIEAESDCIACRLNTRQDAEFIANARTDIPYLLGQLAERDKEIERLQEAMQDK